MRHFARISSILFFLSLLTQKTLAQDGHYWTQQYGTKSMLLSGSVIGGVEDLGAVFYNPARLGLIENPAFLLSADVYEWNRVKVEDATGNSTDLSTSDFGGVPSLAAGTFKVGGALKNHRFAYSILQRQTIDLNLSYTNEVQGDVIDQFPGEEYFRGTLKTAANIKEQWFTFSWSYPISNNISVGLSNIVSSYQQRRSLIIDLQALTSTNQTATFYYERSIGLDKIGLLWKAGLAANWNNIQLGLTVTTPMINLSGSGKYKYNQFFAGIENLTTQDDIYVTNDKSSIPVTVKRPWAIGIGATIPVGRNKIHLSGEWFNSIKQYSMLSKQTHYAQSSGDTITFELVDQVNSVVNGGIGFEFYIKEKISFFTSFSTDFSAVPNNRTAFVQNEPVASNSTFRADFYHFGGGLVLKLKGLDLTLGTTYTGAKQQFRRPLDFPEEGDDGIFDQDEYATLKWERWRFVVSFSVRFLKDVADDLKKRINPE